jgi:hypothetical protein
VAGPGQIVRRRCGQGRSGHGGVGTVCVLRISEISDP